MTDDLRTRLSRKNTSNSTPAEPESPVSGASRAQELKRRFATETRPEAQEPLPWTAPENVPAATVPARMAGTQLPVRRSDSGGDGFDEVAEALMATTGDIVGMIIKYKQVFGKYGFYTKDDICLPFGTQLFARSTRVLWLKWRNGEIVDRREGRPLPERGELDDQNPTKWEIGLNGLPKDCWQKTFHVYFTDRQTCQDFTYISTSVGGKLAVKELVDHTTKVRQDVPGALPVIALAETMRKYKNRPNQPPTPSPLFPVKSWVDCSLRAIDELDDGVQY
jgi:hypothetical protein